ncbi:oxygen-dependent protoporphyrinogen oxidase [Hypoxylon texense]
MPPKRSEDVFISLLRSAYRNTQHGGSQLTPLSTAGTCISGTTSRPLSSLAARGATLHPSIGQRGTRHRTEKLPRSRTRGFATKSTATTTSTRASNGGKPREIAVLGGGITGLTTAHYLARYAKNAHITLYEASSRLGGWVEGKTIQVGEGENDRVLFQHGPRMLRTGGKSLKYDDLVFYDVVASLNLESKLHSWNSRNDRYIYYPDHLVRMPGTQLSLKNVVSSLRSFLIEPLWDGAFRSGMNMLANDGVDPDTDLAQLGEALARDVSVGEFLEEELGVDPRVVRNLASAVMHGIYGGDVYKLSAKCTMLEDAVRTKRLPSRPDDVWIEHKDALLLADIIEGSPNKLVVKRLARQNRNKSLMVFEDGLISLVDGLVRDLEARDNVTIKTGSRITSLADNGSRVSVSTKKSTQQYDQVISTLFSGHLAQLVSPAGSLPSLAATSAVTIMVVNLWFPNPTLLARSPGFGYLVPTTAPDNEECVLGVLFDSDLAPPRAGEPDGTKLTVMLGGHHWDGWSALPTAAMAEEMAVQAVRRHLGIPADEPFFADAALCPDCLPQHHVGHRARMAAAHHELLAAFPGGRLSVAGPSYTAVGVIPAMRAGFDAALRVAAGHGPPWLTPVDAPDQPPGVPGVPDADAAAAVEDFYRRLDHVGATGLAGFADGKYELRGLQTTSKEALPYRAWHEGDDAVEIQLREMRDKGKDEGKEGR